MSDEKIQNSTSNNIYSKEEFLKKFSKGEINHQKPKFENSDTKGYSLDNRRNKPSMERIATRSYNSNYTRSRRTTSGRSQRRESQSDTSFMKILVCVGVLGLAFIVKSVDSTTFNELEQNLSYKLSEVQSLDSVFKGKDIEKDLENLETLESNDNNTLENIESVDQVVELKTMVDFEIEEGLFGEKK